MFLIIFQFLWNEQCIIKLSFYSEKYASYIFVSVTYCENPSEVFIITDLTNLCVISDFAMFMDSFKISIFCRTINISSTIIDLVWLISVFLKELN